MTMHDDPGHDARLLLVKARVNVGVPVAAEVAPEAGDQPSQRSGRRQPPERQGRVTAGPSWESWAPPLAPPADGGLPVEEAEAIAAAWWDDDPHLAAALMWESYAATLPPTPAVSSVTTGYQSVSYGPPTPGGDLGLALARAAWHRSFTTGVSVPLRAGRGPGYAAGPGLPEPLLPGVRRAGRVVRRAPQAAVLVELRRYRRAGRRSAPRSSPGSRRARSAARLPRPRSTTSADAPPGTARTTWRRSARRATGGSRTGKPAGCRGPTKSGALKRPGSRAPGRPLTSRNALDPSLVW